MGPKSAKVFATPNNDLHRHIGNIHHPQLLRAQADLLRFCAQRVFGSRNAGRGGRGGRGCDRKTGSLQARREQVQKRAIGVSFDIF